MALDTHLPMTPAMTPESYRMYAYNMQKLQAVYGSAQEYTFRMKCKLGSAGNDLEKYAMYAAMVQVATEVEQAVAAAIELMNTRYPTEASKYQTGGADD
jgi:hypothetical protein